MKYIVVTSLLASSLFAQAVPEPPVAPNIVLVLADDMAWADVGYNGQENSETPTKAMSTVDSRYEYTFWWYGDERMEPTEELYDLEKDPLEMVNLASSHEYTPVLNMMHEKYEKQHSHLIEEAVDYNGYHRYVSLFDRSVPLDLKEILSAPKNKKSKKEQ